MAKTQMKNIAFIAQKKQPGWAVVAVFPVACVIFSDVLES